VNSFGGRFGLGLFAVIAVIPITFSLIYALLYSIGGAGLLSSGLTPEHWIRVFTGSEVWKSFGLSFYVAAVSTLITLSVAVAVTLVLRNQLDREPLGTLIYLPLAIPATVSAFLAFQFLSDSGFLVRATIALGSQAKPAGLPSLTNDRFAIGIILAHVAIAIPFFVLLLAQTYKTHRIHELNQVAAALGTPTRLRLSRITLPILVRRVMPNTVLFFIYVMGAYEIPLLLGRQSPQMLSVLAMRKYARFDISQKPEAFAIAILYAILVSFLLIALRGQIRTGTEK
jgi:putative spermidine/putrescine transport system permease protein